MSDRAPGYLRFLYQDSYQISRTLCNHLYYISLNARACATFTDKKGFDSPSLIRYTNAILADYEISIGPFATLNAYFLLTASFSDKLGVLWKISRSVNHEVMG